MKEEIFGPIAPIYRFESIEEAIQIANSTPSGLAAYVYTEDYRKIRLLSEKSNRECWESTKVSFPVNKCRLEV